MPTMWGTSVGSNVVHFWIWHGYLAGKSIVKPRNEPGLKVHVYMAPKNELITLEGPGVRASLRGQPLFCRCPNLKYSEDCDQQHEGQERDEQEPR